MHIEETALPLLPLLSPVLINSATQLYIQSCWSNTTETQQTNMQLIEWQTLSIACRQVQTFYNIQ